MTKTLLRLFGPLILLIAVLGVNVAFHHDSVIPPVTRHVSAQAAVTTTTTTVPARTRMWARLADCESGAWDRYKNPIPGSRRWDDRRGGYEGGLHFAPSTWDANRAPDMPSSAADADAIQQVWVGERVLVRQGARAWPVCSRKVGMR